MMIVAPPMMARTLKPWCAWVPGPMENADQNTP